jgi:hypothetical protein
VSEGLPTNTFTFPFLLVNHGNVDRCEKHGELLHHRPCCDLTRFRSNRVTLERNFAGLREQFRDCLAAGWRPPLPADKLQHCSAHGFSWTGR